MEKEVLNETVKDRNNQRRKAIVLQNDVPRINSYQYKINTIINSISGYGSEKWQMKY